MLFTSQFYLLFLLLCFAVYWALPARGRKPWLVVASYVFYATWGPQFLVLLLGVPPLAHILGGAWPSPMGWLLAATAIPAVVFVDAVWKRVATGPSARRSR